MSQAHSNDLNSLIQDSFIKFLDYIELAQNDPEVQKQFADDTKRAEILYAVFTDVFQAGGVSNEKVMRLLKLRAALSSETDRGCALMAAAYLDLELVHLIQALLVDDSRLMHKLFGETGALGSFSARIDMSLALGQISYDTARDSHLLRKIRNDFAHLAEKISFATDPVSSRCRELRRDGLPPDTDPRHKFTRAMMGCAASIHVALGNSTHITARQGTDVSKTTELYKSVVEVLRARASEPQTLDDGSVACL